MYFSAQAIPYPSSGIPLIVPVIVVGAAFATFAVRLEIAKPIMNVLIVNKKYLTKRFIALPPGTLGLISAASIGRTLINGLYKLKGSHWSNVVAASFIIYVVIEGIAKRSRRISVTCPNLTSSTL